MKGVSHGRIGFGVGAVVGHLSGTEAGFARILHPVHLPGPIEAAVATASVLFVAGTAGAVLASLPDADQPNGGFGGLLPKVFHWLTPGHRRGTHSLLALAIWWLVVAYVCAGFGIPAPVANLAKALIVCAVGSHLLADALTDHGIRPLYPFSDYHLRSLLPFTTGSRPEGWVVAGVLVLAAALVVDPLRLAAWVSVGHMAASVAGRLA